MTYRYNYDKKSDSLHIHLKEGEEESFEEVVPGINIEFDEKNQIIGIEILKASRFTESLKKPVSIKTLNMKPIKIFFDKVGNTLNVWFDDPKKESVSEETSEEAKYLKKSAKNQISFALKGILARKISLIW